MSNESVAMETVSVHGKTIEPGGCWGQWDKDASECAQCQVAKNCCEATSRQASGQKKPKTEPPPKPAPARPAPAKPAPAKQEAAPEPARNPEPEVKEQPVTNPEPANPPTAATPEAPEAILARVVNSEIGGSSRVDDNGETLVVTFFDSKKATHAAAVINKGGRTMFKSRKGKAFLEMGFSEDDAKATLRDLL